MALLPILQKPSYIFFCLNSFQNFVVQQNQHQFFVLKFFTPTTCFFRAREHIMEGVFAFLVNVRGMIPYLEQPLQPVTALYQTLKIIVVYAEMALHSLLATQCAQVCPQTRAELLSTLSRLLVLLARFDMADVLCHDLLAMRAVVQSISAPIGQSKHALAYSLLSKINEYAGRLMLGDHTVEDNLVRCLDYAVMALEQLSVTPGLKLTVVSIASKFKGEPSVPVQVSKAVAQLKKVIYCKRVKRQLIV